MEENKSSILPDVKTLLDADNKPGTKELSEYYKTNYDYFMQIANYAYKNNKDYYNAIVYPIFQNVKSTAAIPITCPYCHNTVTTIKNSKTSTGGVIMIIAGLLLAPILIGIALIFIGISMKDYYSICPICKMKLG